MTLLGADIDKLTALGRLFDARSATVAQLAAEASGSVQALNGLWQGPDAGQFQQRWASIHRPSLIRASRALAEAAATVRRNAAEQVTASTADGGRGGADGGRGGADGGRGGPDRGRDGSGAPDASAGTPGAPIVPGFHFGNTGRPDIHHDNGFLQNPDDDTDPVPIPTRPPTQEEQDYYDSELLQARGADVVSEIPGTGRFDQRLELEDGIEAYHHFLNGEGEPRSFDYGTFLDEDRSGQVIEHNALADSRAAADEGYRQLVASGQAPADGPVTFEVTSDQIGVSERNFRYPYPDEENWQKAIGGHSMWTTTSVTYTPQPDGTVRAAAVVTLHAEDRFNFNRDQQDIATGQPDALRGVLEESGLAQQYTQSGVRSYDVTWNEGDPTSELSAEPTGSR